MHHGIGLHSGYALLIVALIIGAGGVVAVSVALAWRHKDQPRDRQNGADETACGAGNEDEYSLQEQVLYLMRQKGGPVLQEDLCTELTNWCRIAWSASVLASPFAERSTSNSAPFSNVAPPPVARAVHDVEQANLIRRDWQPGKADYAVVLTEE